MKKFLVLLFFVTTLHYSVAVYSKTFNYDVNGNGYVTAADITALYDYLLGNVPSDEHEYVDLGLPSGTLWATMNIGANSLEEFGDYFAWGETAPKDSYTPSTYKWCYGDLNKLTKYCCSSSYGYNGFVDNKSVLDPEDDAATANWGPEWSMPTIDQWLELLRCTCVWTTMNGVNGRLFTSKVNGATLFLPGASYVVSSLVVDNRYGYYWSCELYDRFAIYGYNPEQASIFNFTSYYVTHDYPALRDQGCSVRAVHHDAGYNYDVNGDGVVTAADVSALYDYMLGNLPIYVDLGLPSGTLWATMNIGANSPEDLGDYFAWGETQPKDVYDWTTYKWCNGSSSTLTKYCTKSSYGYNGFTDGKTELDPEDDAATVNWGSEWRMPTKSQIEELRAECTWQWTTRNGVKGSLLISNHNGESLFLPAAGYRLGRYLSSVGSEGDYWSRTLYNISADAYDLGIHSGNVDWSCQYRYYGQCVRAVRVL